MARVRLSIIGLTLGVVFIWMMREPERTGRLADPPLEAAFKGGTTPKIGPGNGDPIDYGDQPDVDDALLDLVYEFWLGIDFKRLDLLIRDLRGSDDAARKAALAEVQHLVRWPHSRWESNTWPPSVSTDHFLRFDFKVRFVARSIVSALDGVFESKDRDVRVLAAIVLAELGPSSSDAGPVLAKALEDPDFEVRFEAAAGHYRDERTVPTLAHAVNRVEYRSKALLALSELGPRARDAIPVLAKIEPDFEVVRALAAIGAPANTFLPVLDRALRSRCHYTRAEALTVLGEMELPEELSGATAEAIERIKSRLDEQRDGVRESAVLSRLDPAHEPNLSACVSALSSGSEWRICSGAAACAVMGERARSAAPELISVLLESGMSEEYLAAARALGAIRPPPETAVPAITQKLADTYNYGDWLHRPLIEALAAATSHADDAARALLDRLAMEPPSDDDFFWRNVDPTRVVRYMGWLADESALARDYVLDAAARGGGIERCEALLALAKFRQERSTAIDLLETGLEAPDFLVRMVAARALGDIGPAAARARQTLENIVMDPDERSELRGEAREALRRIGS
ncbi:MAG: HEAT repeat domain-containing protein [Planctomycetota bacterium]